MQFWSTFKLFECAILIKIRSKTLHRNCIYQTTTTCDNELLQTLFWTKTPPNPLVSRGDPDNIPDPVSPTRQIT